MDISTALISNSLPAKTVPADVQRWAIGQLLNATVVEKKPENTVLLQVKDQLIEAKAKQAMPVNVGDSITLRVEKNGTPALLKLVNQTPATTVKDVQQQLLRENLPRQTGLDKLTSLLSQSQTKTPTAINTLPLPVKNQIHKIINQLPTPNILNTAQGLKSALRDSGIFFEAKLLKHVSEQSNPGTIKLPTQQLTDLLAPDLKANLQQLAKIIKDLGPQTPIDKQQLTSASPSTAMSTTNSASNTKTGVNSSAMTNHSDISNRQVAFNEKAVGDMKSVQQPQKQTNESLQILNKINTEQLGKQIEASIARIETHQTRALVTDGIPVTGWSFEMPVKDKDELDLLKLELEQQHTQDNEESKNNWTVRMRIEFEGLGALSARLSIYDGDVNVAIWSEQTAIDTLIGSHIDLLNAQMQRRGLAINKLQHLHNVPDDKDMASMSSNLINIQL